MTGTSPALPYAFADTTTTMTVSFSSTQPSSTSLANSLEGNDIIGSITIGGTTSNLTVVDADSPSTGILAEDGGLNVTVTIGTSSVTIEAAEGGVGKQITYLNIIDLNTLL